MTTTKKGDTLGIMTLTPAYGRDYKTAKEAKEAFKGGKDWIIQDMSSPYDGKPANASDLKGTTVKLRFSNLRKVAVVKA